MNPPNRAPTCTACGASLTPESLDGLCPACLLAVGLEADLDSRLQIRCPNCQIPIEIVDEPSLREVTCPSCDSRFSLIGDQTITEDSQRGGNLGRFELIQRVGVGAFGSVWKARDPELQRIVAVKVPRKEQLSAKEAEQFLREARAAAKVEHAGIVRVHEVGRDEDRIYIVSDFIEGVTLADSLSARRPSVTEAARICAQVAEALAYAHRCGVVHRDLKPSNIMIDPAGQPHVMDFGLAKQDAAEVTMTIEGRILGTPAYMSPEQARGEGHQADARSDVYSLGVILFELLTGEKPFRGTRAMLLQQVMLEEPPSPRRLSAQVPRDVETICLKCLEKEPERRFQHADDLALELRRFLDGQPIQSRPISRASRMWRWCRRNPELAGLTAAVAASLLIGLATTTWQWRIAQNNLAQVQHANETIQIREREKSEALSQSQSRLARIFAQRGLQDVDTFPHAGLPWLMEALKADDGDPLAHRQHRIRIGTILHDVPALLGFWPRVTAAQFTNDGQSLAVAEGRRVRVYQLSPFQVRSEWETPHEVERLQFSPNGKRLATIIVPQAAHPVLQFWDPDTARADSDPLDLVEPKYNSRDVPTIHFTPGGDRFTVVCAGMYNRWHSKLVTRVFDAATLEQISPTFGHHSDLDYINGYHQLSPDALHVIVPRGVPADHPNVAWTSPDWPDELMDHPQQYDLMTGQQVHPPIDHVGDFYDSLAYNRDGSLFGTASTGKIKIFHATSGAIKHQSDLTTSDGYANIVFHPDGESFFAIEKNIARWMSLADGAERQSWKHAGRFQLDPQCRFAVWNEQGGESYLQDLNLDRNDRVRLPDMYRAEFCAEGNRFVHFPRGYDQSGLHVSPPERVLESATGKSVSPAWRFDGGDAEYPLNHNGRFLMSQHDGSMWLWDLDQRSELTEEIASELGGRIDDVQITSKGEFATLLTEDMQIHFLNTSRGVFDRPPLSVAVATDHGKIRWSEMRLNETAETLVLLGGYPNPVEGNANRTYPCLTALHLPQGEPMFDPIRLGSIHASIESAGFIDSGKRLLVAVTERIESPQPGQPDSVQSKVMAIDMSSGESTTLQSWEHTTALFLSADATHCLVTRQDRRWPQNDRDPAFANGVARVYKMPTWEAIGQEMAPVGGTVENAVLSPNNSRVLMGVGEIWDWKTGRRIASLNQPAQPQQFVFSSDPHLCVSVAYEGQTYWDDPSELRYFDIRDGSVLSPPMTNVRTGVPLCAIHPDGRTLAAVGHGLRLWDLESGTMLSVAKEMDEGTAKYVFFTPNGDRLYVVMKSSVHVLPWSEMVKSIPSDDALDAWSQMLSGIRIDPAGGDVPMSAPLYQAAWETISQAEVSEQ